MQKYKHIKALFFLGLFSMLLLHQVVPHVHHHHDVEHTHKAVANSDRHHHDHHHHSEKENSEKGFLDLFLEVHVHSLASTEIVVTQQSSLKQVKVKKDVQQAVPITQHYRFRNVDNTDNTRVYHPPNTFFNSYLTSLDSRGPPTLG